MSLQTLAEDPHIYISTKIQFFLKPRKLVSVNLNVFTVHVIDKYVCISKYIYTIGFFSILHVLTLILHV
jgi:hypothetical protein